MKCHSPKRILPVAVLLAVVALCAGILCFAAPALADDEYFASEEMGDPISVDLSREQLDTVRPMSTSGIVVALDPGHGGNDTGATASQYGLVEKDLTWQIYSYTKEWLEQHGVTVFVTHGKDENVYDKQDDGSYGWNTPSVYQRVQRAVDAGACVFVSQHINETPSGTGFEIYVPYECNYNPQVRAESMALAKSVSNGLSALGLKARGNEGYPGVKTRVTTGSSYRYANGDNGDYYGITRYSRQAGMPSILIEHAFIDNPNDAKLLKDEGFLRKIGYADAEAIYANLDNLYQSFLSGGSASAAKAQIAAAADGSVFRLYNKKTGDHLFTLERNEANNCVNYGWTYEGVNWMTPTSGDTPVWRLRNTKNGDHLYTTDDNEVATLSAGEWVLENNGNPAFYGMSKGASGALAVYRLFNESKVVGSHLYTTQENEYNVLQSPKNSWTGEGVAFYALAPADSGSTTPSSPSVAPSNPTPASSSSIMGESSTTKAALANRFVSLMERYGKSYPAVYASKGAATVRDFANVLWDQAVSEGVRPEVLLAQVIEETGWLQFGGDVKPEQCNFGGIGATGGGNPGNSFPDVKTGLLAQTQHLKAYASKEPLKTAKVDPRFDYVDRGCAPTLEALVGHWAMNPSYATNLKSILNQLLG